MRFWISGPRVLGIRPGISFSPADFHPRHSRARRQAVQFIFVREGETGIEVGVTANPGKVLFLWLGTTNGDPNALVRAAQTDVHASGTPEKAIEAVTTWATKLGWTVIRIPSDTEFRAAMGQAHSPAATAAATTGGILAGGAIGVFAACMVATMIAANFPTPSKQQPTPPAPALENAPASAPVRQVVEAPAPAPHAQATAAPPPAVEVAKVEPPPALVVPDAAPVRRNLQRLTVCDDAANVAQAVTTHRAHGCRSAPPGTVEVVRDPVPGSHTPRIVEVRVIEDGREVTGYAPRSTP